MKYKRLSLTVFFAILFCCVKAQYKEGSIPADLQDSNYVLLVMKDEKGMMKSLINKRIGQALKDYKGKYELVAEADLNDPKYADTLKYRYVVAGEELGKTEGHTYNQVTNASGNVVHNQTTTVSSGQLFFYDRAVKKQFPDTGPLVSNFITGLRELVKYLNKQSKK